MKASKAMESHKRIEDRAAELLAKRDSGNWTEEDQAQFSSWIEEATAHRVAVLRLEGVWEEARRLRALGIGREPGHVPPPGEWRQSPFFDQREALGSAATPTAGSSPTPFRSRFIALAASIVLALTAGLYLYGSGTFAGDRYTTPIGGTASVPISDGSKVTLNTDSQIRVALTDTERRIDLKKGEAFFEVAHDVKRPFIVTAGTKRIIAVGTKFAVRREGDDVRVVVTEGTVRLESAGTAFKGAEVVPDPDTAAVDAGNPANRAGSNEIFLLAGAMARALDGDVLVQNRTVPQAEEALSWRQGYLTFHETTLAEATEEFNRYNKHKLSVGDPRLASLRISGSFRPTNYEAFVRLLEDGFSIHATSRQETTTFTRD